MFIPHSTKTEFLNSASTVFFFELAQHWRVPSFIKIKLSKWERIEWSEQENVRVFDYTDPKTLVCVILPNNSQCEDPQFSSSLCNL